MPEIIIYTNPDKSSTVEVRFEEDSAWLSQQQMAELFGQTKQNVSLHINNCFRENELDQNSVVKDSLITAADGKNYKTKLYNLDVIISVGYRIKSKRGTQFRQWATERLREYLLKGYTLNHERLKENNEGILRLREALSLISEVRKKKELSEREMSGILEILHRYSESFRTIELFDADDIDPAREKKAVFIPDKIILLNVVSELRQSLNASASFGKIKEQKLDELVGEIFPAKRMKTIAESASLLLYEIIKKHPFEDGNKRIAAFLFVYFLEKNNARTDETGKLKINADGLTALTLLVDKSLPSEKEKIIRLLSHLVN